MHQRDHNNTYGIDKNSIEQNTWAVSLRTSLDAHALKSRNDIVPSAPIALTYIGRLTYHEILFLSFLATVLRI